MRHLLVIGIGAGDPEQLTLQAVRAMNAADVFFLLDKGETTDDLTALRRELCARHVTRPVRFVVAQDPARDRAADGYVDAVADWHARRAEIVERMVLAELDEDGTGAFLVWGDPALYDGTLRVLDLVAARGGVAFDVEMIPGISAIATLTARHRVPLNRIGRPVHVTTGRRLAADGMTADDVVVMLDAHDSWHGVDPAGVEIYWGAYLGTPAEILVAGPLAEVADEISARRAAARAAHGWIMDTYLLRRSSVG